MLKSTHLKRALDCVDSIQSSFIGDTYEKTIIDNAKKEIEAAQHEREKLLEVLEDAARVLEWGEPQPKPVLGRVQEILSKAKDEKPSTLVDTNDMVELVINGNLVDVFPNEQDCKAYLKDKYGDSLPPSIVAIAILPFGKMVPFNRRR